MFAVPAAAQQEVPEVEPPLAGILILNQERLFAQSLFGQRIQRELEDASTRLAAENRRIEAAGAALAAENRQIEAQLTEEELALTERRALMTPEAFRPVAQDFDDRVNGIRAAQEAKGRALQQQAEAAQQAFFDIAFPILVEILRSRGASILMDNRAVLLSADGIDITDEAVALIDDRLGEGGPEPLIDLDGTAQAPRPRPEVEAPTETAP
jgi:Skp family chaperone for outer membrane proteins